MNRYLILTFTLLFVAAITAVIILWLKRWLKSGKTPPVSKEKLIDPSKKQAELMLIKCQKCQHKGKPVKWAAYMFFGIGFLFTILNLIGVLIYFVTVNPYICPNCKERNKLIKILNNGTERAIGGLSKTAFLAVCVPLLLLGIYLAFNGNLVKYQSN